MKSIQDHFAEMASRYDRSSNRLILLDYDGSLVPFTRIPEIARPSEVVKRLLRSLASDPANKVVIVSGRDADTLNRWLGDLPIQLVAEHGAFFRGENGTWMPILSARNEWIPNVLPSLTTLANRFEGTFVEQKYFSLVWHYRDAAFRISEREVMEVFLACQALPQAGDFIAYREDCCIELRSKGVDKGRFASVYLQENGPLDFGLAIGDGATDEDLFRAAGNDLYTIRVGFSENSAARFFVNRQEDVLPLLAALAAQQS